MPGHVDRNAMRAISCDAFNFDLYGFKVLGFVWYTTSRNWKVSLVSLLVLMILSCQSVLMQEDGNYDVKFLDQLLGEKKGLPMEESHCCCVL